MHVTDLLILGAGPAGISTALHLLDLDPSWAERLIVLEKAAHPRPKLCAGGVTRFGLGILRDLGFPDPLPLPQVSVNEARLTYGTRVVHVRSNPEFIVFQRAEFDAYLASQARRRGVVILEENPVQSLRVDQGVTAITPKGSYHARAAVGADGAKGLTRRMVNGPRTPGRIARLLEIVTPAPEGAPQFEGEYALLDFTPVRADLQGYVWNFPSRVGGRAHFNRGVYDARIHQARPRARLMPLLQAALQSWGDQPQDEAVEGHPIHRFSPRSRFAIPHLLLVGDAAGVDPLFGEGIGPALGYLKRALWLKEKGIYGVFGSTEFMPMINE